MGKEKENSYWKMKKSLEERHTLKHGNLIEIFWRLLMSFSIRIVCEHTVKIAVLEDMEKRYWVLLKIWNLKDLKDCSS